VVVGRSKVATTYGIVAASQPLAARAGVQVLERGGNAIDAAIATNAVLGLVEPEMNGIGGDLFAIIYEARTGKLPGLNAGGWAPTGLARLSEIEGHRQDIEKRHLHGHRAERCRLGCDAFTVRQLAGPCHPAPAIFYAEHGFPVSEVIAGTWAQYARSLTSEPEAAKTFLIDGRAPKPGELFKDPDLASTLRLIGARGAPGFYEGKTAEKILAISREKGGTMTAADLREFKPEWVDPISTTYRGWTVSEPTPIVFLRNEERTTKSDRLGETVH
jgi:gamma-glutamyltranspeptidase/glutathione hydrolase